MLLRREQKVNSVHIGRVVKVKYLPQPTKRIFNARVNNLLYISKLSEIFLSVYKNIIEHLSFLILTEIRKNCIYSTTGIYYDKASP